MLALVAAAGFVIDVAVACGPVRSAGDRYGEQPAERHGDRVGGHDDAGSLRAGEPEVDGMFLGSDAPSGSTCPTACEPEDPCPVGGYDPAEDGLRVIELVD